MFLKSWCGSSAWLECRPVTPEVASSSLVRTAKKSVARLTFFVLWLSRTRDLCPLGDRRAASRGIIIVAHRPRASVGSSLVRTAEKASSHHLAGRFFILWRCPNSRPLSLGGPTRSVEGDHNRRASPTRQRGPESRPHRKKVSRKADFFVLWPSRTRDLVYFKISSSAE